MENSKEQIKKFSKKEVIFYSIFGIISIFINIGSFYAFCSFFNFQYNTANLLSIALAVISTYFFNKEIVFHSEAYDFGEKVVEFCKFLLSRLFTMAFEYIGCYLLFEYTPFYFLIDKCIMTIIVFIIDFIISMLFTFKK